MELYHVCPQCFLPAGECHCEDVKRKRADDEQSERDWWEHWVRDGLLAAVYWTLAGVAATLILVGLWLKFFGG